MSRSERGEKGPGYDYWGRRALSTFCSFGPYVKFRTKRIERRRAKDALRKGEDDMPQKEAV